VLTVRKASSPEGGAELQVAVITFVVVWAYAVRDGYAVKAAARPPHSRLGAGLGFGLLDGLGGYGLVDLEVGHL
jgi:hypothetical protein